MSNFWLGIDAGGTHCRVRLENDKGELLGVGKAPTGHPVHGMEEVSKNVLLASNQALEAAGIGAGNFDNIIAGGGYAGAHLPRFSQALMAWPFPFSAHYITTDLHAACFGGLGGEDGGAIILGTGFSAMANVKGHTHFIGGQGFLLGDIASGAWFGLQGVRYALAYRDGMRSYSGLVDVVEQTLQASGAELADQMIVAQPNEFARCAKGIFDVAEQGDDQANALIRQAVADVSNVVTKLRSLGCPRIAMFGSVGSRLLGYLPQEIARYLVKPQGSAESGAIWFAKQQWQKHRNPHHVA